jgi:hypothetical protein
MECALLGWLNLIVLTATGTTIVWYTVETYKLRREAQTQTELQIRPFLSLTFDVSDRSLLLYNFGRGVARTIRVQDSNLSPPGIPENLWQICGGSFDHVQATSSRGAPKRPSRRCLQARAPSR